MKKEIIIVLVASIALLGFLYTRPKFVVKDEAKKTTEAPAGGQVAEKSTEDTPHQDVKLTKEQRAKVNELIANPSLEDLRTLGTVYVQAMAFDSAGYYFEKVATATKAVNDWQIAGDMYFQAFNLALKPASVEKMAQKTQTCYEQVLVLKPTALQAKTNLAMTYVASASPMQAIQTLRQVLEVEPNFEPALMNLGVLSMQSNQFDKAADRFRAVLRVNPNNHNATVGLGYSLIELGQKPQAKTLLEELLQHKDLEAPLRQEVSNTLQNLK